ncbi:MFS transporter [Peribacillus sp. TH27]|uniref:MFS transporter n=1 Tax=Peribacillus sp. TH27 TaxID=2798484 RepID=UPI0019135D84|nr:MFS transporter [Peribacillus sp. TH27]MBK5458157.1 MFS transporter [Peribacillus sp. TH27]
MNTKVKSAFVALSIAWLAYLLSYVSRMSWSPIIPIASGDLGINATQAGSYMTAFYIGYVVTQIPGGFLIDRYGYRKVLLGCFSIIGLFTFLTGVAPSFEIGIATRVIAGIGSGAIFSAGLVVINDWFPENRRGLANGIFMTATSLAVSLVNLYVPTMANGFGWRSAFYVSGILPLIGLVIAFFFLKERTPISQNLKGGNRDKVSGRDILSLFKNKNLMLTGIAGFGGQWATMATATWANSYLNKSLHLSLVQAGLFMSIFGFAALLSKPVTGILSDYYDRKALTFWILILLGPVLLWFGHNKNLPLLYLLIPAMGILGYAFYPVLNTVIGHSVEKRLLGTASGLVNAMWQLGAMLSPLAVGAVIDATGNYFYCFATMAIGPFLGALIFLFIKLEKKASKIKQNSVEEVQLMNVR